MLLQNLGPGTARVGKAQSGMTQVVKASRPAPRVAVHFCDARLLTCCTAVVLPLPTADNSARPRASLEQPAPMSTAVYRLLLPAGCCSQVDGQPQASPVMAIVSSALADTAPWRQLLKKGLPPGGRVTR